MADTGDRARRDLSLALNEADARVASLESQLEEARATVKKVEEAWIISRAESAGWQLRLSTVERERDAVAKAYGDAVDAQLAAESTAREAAANADETFELIERTVRVASDLGPNAFDFVEGRGLHQMRLAIKRRLGSRSERDTGEAPGLAEELHAQSMAAALDTKTSEPQKCDYVDDGLRCVLNHGHTRAHMLALRLSPPASEP